MGKSTSNKYKLKERELFKVKKESKEEFKIIGKSKK